ncbi:hypothetical protein [Pseudofrankia sp. DC12]|uniref:hypothetical protein n=1 Tax=Pseudofrankia sp. DC12 TaxID=683315 RepID=UPI0005F7C635|nr:hypothetical protein [Pseudofrankia sp. DC12]
MPQVALTLASVPARLSSHPAPAIAPCPAVEAAPVPVALPALAESPVVVARGHLRLVTFATAAIEVDEIHGHGGPASCHCRACAMARHPASLPRLSVVR